MTQTASKKTQYPQGHMLVTRECMKAICLGNGGTTRMLSVLMFRYDYSPYPAINGLFAITCTQADIVRDSCEEITEKTIHDSAGPLLQLLGFLDVEERMGGNRYILHIDVIHEALRLYGEDKGQLEKFLINNLQLERFLIEPNEVLELEGTLINRKKLQSQLEKVLIAIRKSSNCRRGPKARSQGASGGQDLPPENKREYSENNTERKNGVPPMSSPDSPFTQSLSNSHDDFSSAGERAQHALISHPVHKFIFLDDPATTLFLQLGDPDDEHGNKSRIWIAHDVQRELETRLGYKLIRRFAYEQRSIEGGVTTPPASAKRVSLSPNPGGDLATSPATGRGDTQLFSPDPVGEGSASHLPIVASMDTVILNNQQDTLGVQGYMNEESLHARPPDSDALLVNLEQQSVASNDTEALPLIQSLTAEQQLSQWITDERIPKARNPEAVTRQITALVERGVGTLEKLKSLRKHTQDEINADESRKNKTCYLGNMVTALDRWLESQASPPKIGMTEAQLSLVFDALPACIPNSALRVFAVNKEKTLFTLVLIHGSGERDFYEIVRFEDAPFVYGHHQVQADCAAYGQQIAQPLEALAV